MKAEELERAREYAINGYQDGEGHPLEPVDAEIKAMRTPITPESLRADGWTRKTEYDDIFVVEEFMLGGARVRIGGGVVIVGVGGRRFDGVANMYDLRELVRLLGGAQ